jgi:hypothetical protein
MADRKSPIQRLYYFHGGVQKITSATPEGEVSLMADRKSPIQRLYYFHGGVQKITSATPEYWSTTITRPTTL